MSTQHQRTTQAGLTTWRAACSQRVARWLAAQMPAERVLTALGQALTLR